MINSPCGPSIHKARRKSLQQFQSPIRLSQEQTSGIRGLLAPIESRCHLSGKMFFELETSLTTLCHKKGRLSFGSSDSSQKPECHAGRPFLVSFLFCLLTFFSKFVRNAG
jgi:hypothetical protein